MVDCPFCRTIFPGDDGEALTMLQARVGKKDPEAIYHLGKAYCNGMLGLQRDTRKAVELWTEAAELGSIDALFHLGAAYFKGEGVEQDMAKGAEFYKNARTS